MSLVLQMKKKVPAAKLWSQVGIDWFRYFVYALDDFVLNPCDHCLADTGVAFQLVVDSDVRRGEDVPYSSGVVLSGYEIQIRTLPSFLEMGVFTPRGTIDIQYRGSVGVQLYNFSGKPLIVVAGEPIAELVVCPVERVLFSEEFSSVVETSRGASGFGSTGHY